MSRRRAVRGCRDDFGAGIRPAQSHLPLGALKETQRDDPKGAGRVSSSGLADSRLAGYSANQPGPDFVWIEEKR